MNDVVKPLIPVAYDGREQALVKHRLLEDYLEKLFLIVGMGSKNPDGHPKLLHLWPVKLLQAGRSDYDYAGVIAMREAASFRR